MTIKQNNHAHANDQITSDASALSDTAANIVALDTFTVEPVSTETPKRTFAQPRALQSRSIAQQIVSLRESIENAQNHVELANLMAGRGMDAAQLAQGLSLQNDAAAAYDYRQQAMGASQSAVVALHLAEDGFTDAYLEYRSMARLVLKTPAARTALNLAGELPGDMEEFISHARASLTAALEMPEYSSALETVQYTPERLTALLAQLDALYSALSEANHARGEAIRATQERDKALKVMQEWRARFRTAARFATYRRPDLKARIGL